MKVSSACPHSPTSSPLHLRLPLQPELPQSGPALHSQTLARMLRAHAPGVSRADSSLPTSLFCSRLCHWSCSPKPAHQPSEPCPVPDGSLSLPALLCMTFYPLKSWLPLRPEPGMGQEWGSSTHPAQPSAVSSLPCSPASPSAPPPAHAPSLAPISSPHPCSPAPNSLSSLDLAPSPPPPPPHFLFPPFSALQSRESGFISPRLAGASSSPPFSSVSSSPF